MILVPTSLMGIMPLEFPAKRRSCAWPYLSVAPTGPRFSGAPELIRRARAVCIGMTSARLAIKAERWLQEEIE